MVAYNRKRVPMTKAAAKSRIAAAIKKRRTNQAVKKSYFRKPISKNSNYSAISTLSRQVKMLQMSRYGFKQFQHQHMAWVGDWNLTTVSLTQTQPIAFMANNFYNEAPIYYGTKTGTAPNQIASFAPVGLWNKVRNDSGLDPKYNWNQKQEEETLSTVQYLPLSTTMKVTIKCVNSGPVQTPVRCRVTVLTFKSSSDVTNVFATLPANLGAYAHLVDRDPLTRQYLNTNKFHKVIKEQNLYFPQPDATHNDIERTFSFKHLFDGKTAVEFDKTAEPNTDMRHNIPMNQQVWVIISTDNTDASRLNFQMERWNTWRDQHGVGS